ncbi:family 10 glycosylhydrolase [Natronosporangium hydrolyticum]|uniref:Family 10 glycosylhydrolase n=2 Tax=Natronosporangium hydrolyticum TaxID=2811111 RepID=A0A895YQ07_9ACTN|nr:family 10 glycosylhydrolase [Natronosporangium hydrolyticum]
MWIASVANLDWPSSSGLSAAQQQAEYRAQLDLAEEHQLNTVIVQVRPTADAFWPSPYEPWSHWLTGSQGSDPGYDPLEFMIDETHARGLEFHAWFNPYRVATHDDLSQLHPEHPARQHDDWVFSYGGQLYYDPGVPAVREHVTAAMMHAVSNYDLDGVHWDDYFYPYPSGSTPIPDQDTFAEYGGDFTDIDDWRRDNVDQLVAEMGAQISAEKSHVKFGVSPFGIWRNQSTDPLGSATNGLQSYDAIYADTRRWVVEEWVDYVVPQIYWPIGFAAADYSVLVPWWSDVVAGTQVQLFIGQATYRAGAAGEDPAWQQPSVLSDLLAFNRDHPEVLGDVHFSAKDVQADRIGAMSQLVADHYARPALVPVAPHLGGAAPAAPSGLTATTAGGDIEVSWQAVSGASSYAVYRLDGAASGVDPCDFADARHLLGTTTDTSFADATAAGATYTYHVAALDRLHHESDPSAGVVVDGENGGGDFQTIIDSTSDRFHASSDWGSSSYSPQAYGDTYRFAEPVAASDPAWYQIDVPGTGDYRVEVWYPADPGYHGATPYLVSTVDGLQTVPVDQRIDGGQWVELGTFTLAEGDYDVIGVSRWANGSGYVIADAVRITQV